MIKTITTNQRRRLQNDLKQKTKEAEEDNYSFTFIDDLLLLFLDTQKGVTKNGLEVKEIMTAMGFDEFDFKQLTTMRSRICNFASDMIKEGYPFGGLKVGRYKKYGWTTEKEFDKLQLDRKKRLVKEVVNCLDYLDEDDKLTQIGKKFKKELDSQLKLSFE